MTTATKIPAKRGKYTRPRLVRYGEVRLLTQSGTRAGVEGAGAMMRMPSDRRLKEGFERIGTHPLGIGLYLFEYRAEHRAAFGRGRRFGVIADEVEAVMPHAVWLHPAGFKMVDYALLGICVHGNDEGVTHRGGGERATG